MTLSPQARTNTVRTAAAMGGASLLWFGSEALSMGGLGLMLVGLVTTVSAIATPFARAEANLEP